MTLGAPAALWGLAALPLLVVLYLLRVRRRDQPVSSILLWQRSAPALAAFRPSRRIERSVLLALQLLALAAMVVGLARPAVLGSTVGGRDVVLVLDASLSMQARDVAPTRFERARAEALAVVRRLQPGQRAAAILAAPRPVVLTPLTTDRAAVAAALRRAEPWDAAGDVGAAVTLAGELAGSATDGRVLVWTDAARGAPPAAAGVTYHVLGTAEDNAGIVAFRVLTDAIRPEALVRVVNWSRGARRIPLDVRLGDATVYRATLAVPAGGTATAVFPVRGAGVLHARIVTHDVLPEDDDATALLAPAPLGSVLLVSHGNPALERVLRVLPLARAVETATVDSAAWSPFDVVILDRVDPGPLPPGNYLVLGAVPPNLPATASGVDSRPQIAAWDRQDPVLRFVDLRDVRIDRALQLEVEGGRVLVSGAAPLVWEYTGGGVRALVLGFALEDSDLPNHAAFPILVRNMLAWLGGVVDHVTVGDEIQVPAGEAATGTLTDPLGRRVNVRATDGAFVLPPIARAGLYRFSTAAGTRTFAVEIGSPNAGIIRPGPAPAPLSAAGPAPGIVLVHVPLWPWFLLVGIAALLGEWALATRRPGGDA